MLTPDQLDHFRQHGYVLLGQLLDPPALSPFRDEEARFRRYPQLSFADGRTVLPDTSTLFRNQLANYSVPVRELFLNGPHLDAIEQLIGPLVQGSFTQFVTKLPDTNPDQAIFPWHQDNGYGGSTNPRRVTVWIALDDVDESNGCVWVIPGSHLGGLLPHHATGTSWHLTVDAPNDGIPVPLPAGHAVAFTGLTLHRSLANRSGRPRRAFFMNYTDWLGDQKDEPTLQHHPLWIARGQLPYPAKPLTD